MFGFKKRREKRELAWKRFNEIVHDDLCSKLQTVTQFAIEHRDHEGTVPTILDEAEEVRAGIDDFFTKSAARQPEEYIDEQGIGYKRGFTIAKSVRNLAMLHEHLDNPNVYGDFLHALGMSRDYSASVPKQLYQTTT